MSDKVISSTTQEFLDVYDIVNDMVLLKDGTAAVILQIGTMNFSLLAEQEQDAVIFTYGSLLNSLNYPIQINIQSQTKDATKYLRLLDEQIKKASSDRKAILIRQYRDFVATLIRERNVLQKRFYITVPATPGEMGLITPAGVLPGKTTFDITSVEKSILLEKATNLLEPRRDHLVAQFNRLGLFAKQLSTQEIIQNFYINYNPEAAEGQEISSSENYTTPLVRASFGGKFMQINQQQNNTQPVQNNQIPMNNNQANPQTQAAQITQAAPVAPASVAEDPVTMASEPNQAQMPKVEMPSSPTPEEILGNMSPPPQAPLQTPTPTTTQAPTPVIETSQIQSTDQVIFQNQTPMEPIQNAEPASNQAQSETQQPEIQLGTQLPEPAQSIQDIPMNQPVSAQAVEQAITEPAINNVEPTPELEMPVVEQSQNTESNQSQQTNDFSEDITPLQNRFETPDQNKVN